MDEKRYKANPWMVSTFVLVGVIAGFAIAQIPYVKELGKGATAATIQPTASAPVAAPAVQTSPPAPVLSDTQIASLTDDDPVIGDPKAPITVVEFSDFQCSYCERFYTAVFSQIEENYIKTGKVKFVYRDFPLGDKHPQAELAAEAAECASEQGKFTEMYVQLFSNQDLWSGVEKAKDIMKNFAKTIRLNAKQFNACLDSSKYKNEIQKDLIDGASVGVQGTPSFFVNGKFVEGSLPYDTFFKPIFDAELAGKKWEIQFDIRGNPVSVKIEQ